MAEIKYIPVSKLWRHPDNPRKDLGDVTELAESIKVNGVLQNLTVVPLIGEITKKWDGESYRVIIGHRRLAAAKLAGLEELPCVVVEMSEREQLSTMLTENMQRSDLTVYEQAQGFQMMLDMGDTVEDIAGMSAHRTSRKPMAEAETLPPRHLPPQKRLASRLARSLSGRTGTVAAGIRFWIADSLSWTALTPPARPTPSPLRQRRCRTARRSVRRSVPRRGSPIRSPASPMKWQRRTA